MFENHKTLYIFIASFILFFFSIKTVYSAEIKVISISVIAPDPNNSQFIDSNFVPEFAGKTISQVQNIILNIENQAKNKLEEASAYEKYKNNLSNNYINYNVIHRATYTEKPKLGFSVPWNPSAKRPDYIYYLNNQNICDFVDNKGVRQVWFYTNHNKIIEPAESNLSMGKISSKYFNRGSYGDASNSELTNDLPVCKYSYAVFNYNFTRGVGEFLEDHTHHLESVLKHVDFDLFWKNFVKSCGWTHYPPNGKSDYDWYNKLPVSSDCNNWIPDGGGLKEQVNCYTWGNCDRDSGVSFKVWWMQHLPGFQNSLSHSGKKLRNFWDVVVNLDMVLANENKLYAQKIFCDLNFDNKITLVDLVILITNSGAITDKKFYRCAYDLDGNIKTSDILKVVGEILK